MKKLQKFTFIPFLLATAVVVLSSFFKDDKSSDKQRVHFPYKQAGLTERQAAAHLLSRFTYGATPGQVDKVVEMGLEKWFQQQLSGNLPDDSLNQMLTQYDAIGFSNEQVLANFPRRPQVLKMAIQDGFISKDSIDKSDKKEYKDQLETYMKQKGIRPEQELFRQFINQKILRATYTNNQLQEIMTDFWFNHFNVSITKNDCAPFIPAYERDVIRPRVFGKFKDILLATAKSPAMLFYLDNFSSSGTNDNFDQPARGGQLLKRFAAQNESSMNGSDSTQRAQVLKKLQQAKKTQGLNENYAREVMELHTLGVEGGYSQQDVTQAARVLTGWTIFPITDYGPAGNMRKIIERFGEDRLKERGFVHEGDFLFAVNRHDSKEKTVLGKTFPAGGGYEEGVQLLEMLARHPSTANFISRKIANRFVSDQVPKTLIDKMSKTFLEKDGDITQVILTMVSAPEFWSKEAVREKTKSPFEFAISAVRSLDARVTMPLLLNNWITRMGQKLYFYQAPTGFPDKGQYWINTGSLLNRMNFGLALSSQRIPGITFSLPALNNFHEPESAEAALQVYGKLMLPERDLTETVKRLTPLINDPALGEKVNAAAGKTAPPVESGGMTDGGTMMAMAETPADKPVKERFPKKGLGKNNSMMQMQTATGNNSMLSQVVGIIIGSPEFQRK